MGGADDAADIADIAIAQFRLLQLTKKLKIKGAEQPTTHDSSIEPHDEIILSALTTVPTIAINSDFPAMTLSGMRSTSPIFVSSPQTSMSDGQSGAQPVVSHASSRPIISWRTTAKIVRTKVSWTS